MPVEMYIKPMEIKIQPDGSVKLVDWNKKMPRLKILAGLGGSNLNRFNCSSFINLVYPYYISFINH